MVELLGILLAALLAGLGWLSWRGLRMLRLRLLAGRAFRLPAVHLPRLRGSARLGQARRRLHAADDRAADLVAEVVRLKLALRVAEKERDAARAALVEAPRRALWPIRAPQDDRFQQAKRSFALRFHPDRPGILAAERSVRAAMFREFWGELRRIERG